MIFRKRQKSFGDFKRVDDSIQNDKRIQSLSPFIPRSGDLTIGTCPSNRPVRINTRDIANNTTYLIGDSGSGKSKALTHIISNMTDYSVAVIDVHGSLAEQIFSHALLKGQQDPEILKRLHYFDFSSENPPGLSLVSDRLDSRQIDDCIQFLYTINPYLKQRQEALLQQILPILPNISLWNKFISDESYRKHLIQTFPDEYIRELAQREIIERKKSWARKIEPLDYKLQLFSKNKQLRKVYGHINPINFRNLIKKPGLYIFNLNSGILSNSTADLLASNIFSGLKFAAESRPKGSDPLIFAVDEFARTIKTKKQMDEFTDVMDQLKKWNVHLLLANQNLGQLPDRLATSILSTAYSIFCFNLGDPKSARAMANHLYRSNSNGDNYWENLQQLQYEIMQLQNAHTIYFMKRGYPFPIPFTNVPTVTNTDLLNSTGKDFDTNAVEYGHKPENSITSPNNQFQQEVQSGSPTPSPTQNPKSIEIVLPIAPTPIEEEEPDEFA